MATPTEPEPDRGGRLGRLADAMFVHRRRVLAGWLAVLVLSAVAGTAFKGEFTADYKSPGTGSADAAKLLDERFDGQSGDAVDIVWKSNDGAKTPAATTKIDALLRDVSRVEGVASGATVKTAEASKDGKTAVARMPLDRTSGAVDTASGERIAELVEEADGDGLEVAANGTIAGLVPPAGMTSELVGIFVAALVLLVTFGTVVAAGLPLLIALVGVAVSVMAGLMLAAVVDTPDWAVQVSIMIGIGVGIDYALLILTRFRAARSEGRSPREANIEAMTTAGHSALVAGGTVVIALSGLFLMRLSYLNGVALAASLTVLTVMAATATLLPAIIGMTHRHLDRLQIRSWGQPAADPDATAVARWSRTVDRRPVIALVVSLVALAVLASPLTGIRFGFPDSGNQPKDSTTRQAYDMIGEGFGPGANGPLIAVATTPTDGTKAKLAKLRTEIEEDRDVVGVSPPQFNKPGDAAVMAITPAEGPASTSTTDLVKRLRDGPLHDAGVPVELGGQTASFVDQATTTAERLPLFIGAVVLLAFALLVGAFRAPVIALKAGVLTVLSIAASYGVVALVAEGGWAGQLVGIDSDVPVPPFIPVMMFAVMFGLAMDYEVFLISRIKEERERLGDARSAVRVGLARTSKVITAAALIMMSVFGAFALSPDLILKLIGVGLAAAVFIDAVLVRMVLLPAVMRLLGERAWWTPARRREPQAEVSRQPA